MNSKELLSHLAVCMTAFHELIVQCDGVNQSQSSCSESTCSTSSDRSIQIQHALKGVYSEAISSLPKIMMSISVLPQPLVDLITVTSSMIQSKMFTSRKILLSMSLHWNIAMLHVIIMMMETTSSSSSANQLNNLSLKSLLSSYELLLSIKVIHDASLAMMKYYPSLSSFNHHYPNYVYYNVCLALSSSSCNQQTNQLTNPLTLLSPSPSSTSSSSSSNNMITRIECLQRLVILRILSQSIVSMTAALMIPNLHHELPLQYVMKHHQNHLISSSTYSPSSSLSYQMIQLIITLSSSSDQLSNSLTSSSLSPSSLSSSSLSSSSLSSSDDASSISSMTSIEDYLSEESTSSSISKPRKRSREIMLMMQQQHNDNVYYQDDVAHHDDEHRKHRPKLQQQDDTSSSSSGNVESLDLLSYAANIMILLNQAKA